MMKRVLAVILGGGKGTRLFPLTQYRSKPAVPLGGKYRLIDIPISNCLNSGINRVYVLTQFNSISLHRHIRETYRFDRFDGGFVEIMAAQQTMEGESWYQGTADAVRKNLRYFDQSNIDYVVVLSGDQLYRIDFAKMLETHIASKADATIAALPVTREAARGFGVMRLDDTGRILGFLEKPQTDEEIDMVRMDPSWIDSHGVVSQGRDCLASMGIYIFNRRTLVDLLTKTDFRDFGKEVFPTCIRTHRVQVHLFDGYWEDIGTIRSFYQANIDLAKFDSPFQMEDPDRPIYTHARFLPPTRCEDAIIRSSLLADGCSIGAGSLIENSVIGLRCHIGKNVVIRNSYVMGSDYYESAESVNGLVASGGLKMGIGDGARIENAIIDKNCRIGQKVVITPQEPLGNSKVVSVEDGVVVVAKDSSIQVGWNA